MNKSKYWLFQFIFELDGHPFSNPKILEFDEQVSETVAKLMASKHQGTLFEDWPKYAPSSAVSEITNRVLEKTCRVTPWWSSSSSDKLVLCLYWKNFKPIDRRSAITLDRVGVPWVKCRI